MKTILPEFVDENQPMILSSNTERLLAEILETLEKLVELLQKDKKK